MTKDYFQDIIPPQNDAERVPSSAPIRPAPQQTNQVPPPPPPPSPSNSSIDVREEPPVPLADRSIRNIMPSQTRKMPSFSGAPVGVSEAPRPRNSRGTRGILMVVMALLFVAIIGGLALFGLRNTTITIVPRTHPVTFDETSQLVAVPVGDVASSSLTYTVKTLELEDSEVVAAEGMTRVERKASGSITVINEHSTAPVKLVKNTRFQTPEGLVFRAPADIVVPGMKGTTPGKIDVLVVADQAGEQYNVGPVSRFTLPGLKTGSPMHTHVYAQSSAPMAGGFVGDEPAVAPAVLSDAVTRIRGRLEQKVRDTVAAQNASSTVAFAEAARVTYQDAPTTPEADKGVRIHQKARVELPVFDAAAFAHAIATAVSADAEQSTIKLVPQEGYAAHILGTSTAALGSEPLTVGLSGRALLVWQVDAPNIASALAGKDGGAFKTIVTGFPGVEEAHARIEPFWSKTFPTDASRIKVVVEEPQNKQ